MKIIKRQLYLNQVRPLIDKPLIKIVTGIRRCGKSYFIKQIIEEIKTKNRITEQQILYINKELFEFDFIENYTELYKYVKKYFKDANNKNYLFIDEIQEIKNWEKAIISLFAEEKYDIYITGSNASLLSSELATLLSGRYIQIGLFPFNFNEFVEFRKTNAPIDEEFQLYLQFGGFPVIHFFDYISENIYQYLQSLFNTVLIKDIVTRYNVRNVPLFENITKYVFDNTGNIFSGGSINKYLKSQNISIGLDTIQNYLHYLENSFLAYKVKRYDIKGKKILEIYEKYYLVDVALKHALGGYKQKDISGMLENIVFLHLKCLNYEIFIGKFGDKEVDFVAKKTDKIIYIQVAYLLESEETIKREFNVLFQIKDNYPKYVLSMDTMPKTNNNGIIRMNLIEFLLTFD